MIRENIYKRKFLPAILYYVSAFYIIIFYYYISACNFLMKKNRSSFLVNTTLFMNVNVCVLTFNYMVLVTWLSNKFPNENIIHSIRISGFLISMTIA